MPPALAGRVALVTGAAQSIGEACAVALAGAGAHVLVTDRDRAGAEVVAAALRDAGASASAGELDVTDPGRVDAVVDGLLAEHGRLDVAVNNAGISGRRGLTADLPDAEWQAVLGVDLHAVFACLRAEARAMRGCGGGSIVNVASILGLVAHRGHAPYVTAKHALIGLTRGAALDHAADGIRVNAVAPSWVDTPRKQRNRTADELAAIAARHPLGRLGTCEEVAAAVLWLVGDGASFTTGAVHVLDGGYGAV